LEEGPNYAVDFPLIKKVKNCLMDTMENKDMKVNMNKTKAVISGDSSKGI